MTTTLEETTDTARTSEAEKTPRRSMGERIAGLSGRDRVIIGAGVGIAAVTWILASVLTGGETPPMRELVADAPNPQQSLPEPQAQLTPAEYMELGRGAIKDGRYLQARRHVEQGLASHPKDVGVRAELCRVMADILHRMGQPDAAALYREQAASFMSGLDGTEMLVFRLAEADLAAGNVRAARRRYHAIALGGGQAGGAHPRISTEAERRLARTYEAEFKARSKLALDQVSDPTVFDLGGDR